MSSKEHDHDKDCIEVKLSDHNTVIIKALSAFECIQADDIVGGGESNEAKTNKVYAVCSVRKLNDVAVSPLRNRAEFAAVAQKLSLGELLLLVKHVSEQLMGTFGDDLKNALTAQE